MAESSPEWLEAAFASLVEGTPARVSVVHASGEDAVFELVSRSAAEGLGHDVAELVGRSFRDIYPADAAADVIAQIDRARHSGRHTYETVRDLPGGRQSVHVDVLSLGGDRFLLSSLDISAEREAQRRLDEVARTAKIGVYHWNVVEGEVWWSEELYRLLGHEPGDVEATIDGFIERIHPDDREDAARLTDEIRVGGPTRTTRHRIVTPTGVVKVVEGRARAVTGAGGELLYVLGTTQDITQRVELERDAELLREATARQHTALEVHDRIVQGLSAIWLALELGDIEHAREATRRATAGAQAVVADLLAEVGGARGGVRPGDLVHGRSPEVEEA